MSDSIHSSNGFGSFNFYLMVDVDSPYDKILIDDDWEVTKKSNLRTTFKFPFRARQSGDDESALFELGHSLPREVPMESYRVDWESSSF